MGAVPWHRSRRAVWIAAGAAAVVLAVGLFLLKRKHDEDALFRRALSRDGTESGAARKEIEADVARYSARLSKMLESGDDDEVALAADSLIYLGLEDGGAEWLLRLSRTGTPYRRLRAAILLWWNGRHEERLRAVATEVVQGDDPHLKLALVHKLSRLQVDPRHDREAAELTLGALDALHRDERALADKDTDLYVTTLMWARMNEAYVVPLLEARMASPNAMPWHGEVLRHLRDASKASAPVPK